MDMVEGVGYYCARGTAMTIDQTQGRGLGHPPELMRCPSNACNTVA
jgi:hypothetical protein